MTTTEQRAFFEAQIKNEELDGWKAETYAAALKEAGCATDRIEVFAKQSADHKRIAAALQKQLDALPKE